MTVNTQSTVLEQEAAFAAQQATRSLLYEVSVSPKPGLVDRFDSGAHADMDFFTYLDSSVALTEYFRMTYLEGASSPCLTPPELFPRLRRLGVQAEQQMYAATRGVNTHKGIIFTLGLFCGGLGWLSGRDEPADEVGLLHLCSQIVTPEFEQELRKMPLTSAKSGSERFFVATGHSGIRGEAAAGDPSIVHCGLPALRSALQQGYSINDAGIIVLLELLCCVHDSNLFVRCGEKKQHELAQAAREILDAEQLDLGRVARLNQRCVRDWASPGGCADLLAATFFLHFYFMKPEKIGESISSEKGSLES